MFSMCQMYNFERKEARQTVKECVSYSQNCTFQYFGHLMQRADSLQKTLTLGKIEGERMAEDEMVR